MTYRNHIELAEDLNYFEDIKRSFQRRRYESLFPNLSGLAEVQLTRLWRARIKVKYSETLKSNSAFGRFLCKYNIPFKEIQILLYLTDSAGTPEWLREFNPEKIDAFQLYDVRYESSILRRLKLVFKITNPRSPMRHYYEISYRAQLEMVGKRYTEEYERLDQVFEEDEKRKASDVLNSMFYTKIPKFSFKQLIVNEDVKEKLRAAVERERQKTKIFKDWNIGRSVEYGRGTTLNFRGPPGTGKTMAAGCFAKELGKELIIVRYDQLQDMYVGETEKNIQRAFKTAKQRDAVLFFDEADAVAHSRAMATQSWELSQSNTLLKELERFEGACIFATNFAQKYDPAFQRRLTMHIDFKLPTQKQAKEILNNLLPKKSRSKNLSLQDLPLEDLSGGDLKNVVLNAAGVAVKEKSAGIKNSHLKIAIEDIKGKSQVKQWYIQ